MKNNSTISYCGIFMFIFSFLVSNFSDAQVIYVDRSAVGSNNGTSWSNAFTDLSSALTSATSGDAIWIADGVYKPRIPFDFDRNGGTDPREATFTVPVDVALYGGFNGGESSVDERDWETFHTILSGDIDNNDTNADGNSIAENTDHIAGNNAYHVISTFNGTSLTRIDGLVITAGQANYYNKAEGFTLNSNGGGWYNITRSILSADGPSAFNSLFQGNYSRRRGGAIYNDETSSGLVLHINNCRFIENLAFDGGAIFLTNRVGDLIITDCEFIRNKVFAAGGALYLTGDNSFIESTLFSENSAGGLPEDFDGFLRSQAGAILLVGSNANFRNCIFERNVIIGDFGAGPIEGGGGGAIRIVGNSRPIFLNCGFYNNEASGSGTWGGAILHYTRDGLLQPKYINCVFAGNQTTSEGGAIASYMEYFGEPRDFMPALTLGFTNCTFVNNHAGLKGGAIYNDEFTIGPNTLTCRLENCILWGNPAGIGDEVYSELNNIVINPITYITHSIIQRWGGSGTPWNPATGVDGGGNTDTNPNFIDITNPYGVDGQPATNDDGLLIAAPSDAVNNGNNDAAGLIDVTTDYRGNLRIVSSTVDIGAYEQTYIRIPPDRLTPWSECRDCPWAFLLRPFELYFVWDGEGAIFESEDGKSATIEGKIVSLSDKNIAFEVYLKLTNAYDWKSWQEKNRSYVTYSPEATEIAKKTINSWKFWELSSESYMIGKGSLSGTIKLEHYPATFETGFQVGPGANGWDKDNGQSGTFTYEGTLLNNGKTLKLKGVGSMNVDVDVCTDCSPSKFNAVRIEENVLIESNSTKTDFIAFPTLVDNHVTILSESLPSDRYSIMVYDTKGNLRKTQTMNTDDGNSTLLMEGMSPGVYVIKLISSRGDVLEKKVIVN